MIILDTDHLSEFQKGTSSGRQLKDRLERCGEPIATTIISAEELMRGWLAAIQWVPGVERSEPPARATSPAEGALYSSPATRRNCGFTVIQSTFSSSVQEGVLRLWQ